MMYKNKDIRKALIDADVTGKQIATALGYSAQGFYRLINDEELPTDEKSIILRAIDEIAYGNGDQYVADELKSLRKQKRVSKKPRRKRDNNSEIRNYAKEKRVYLYEVAEKLGLSEASMSRKMRYAFNDEEKRRIFSIIDEIAEKGDFI